MILISVKSDVVHDKRQFKSDSTAMRFLKTINRLHDAHRIKMIGAKPLKKDFKYRIGRRSIFDKNKYTLAVVSWQELLNKTLKLKVEIVNTKSNQINMTI